MAKIFITGSADGLGFLAGKELLANGHDVIFHTRNEARAQSTVDKLGIDVEVLIGDLSKLNEVVDLAGQVNGKGTFDAVIHNAGVYQASGELITNVNSIAPYVLSALINLPKRLIYLSSGLHQSGKPKLEALRDNHSSVSYSDSKLHNVLLTCAMARKYPDVISNAVDPGWVPTKMGGAGAIDSLQKGYETQVWLCESNEREAISSGNYFFHKRIRTPHADSAKVNIQDAYLEVCKELTGINLP